MSQPGSAADSRTVRRTVHRCSRSRGIWAIGSTGSSNTVGARAQRELEALYCVACCWGLTALLFFGGVMNLCWRQICRCGDLRRTDLTLVVLRPWGEKHRTILPTIAPANPAPLAARPCAPEAWTGAEFLEGSWRPRPESNRGARICNPHNRGCDPVDFIGVAMKSALPLSRLNT